jgi:hypothetical protein
MNDRDWMKKFRRGRKGGCTTLLMGMVAALVGLVALI